jgi:hypothetical protein
MATAAIAVLYVGRRLSPPIRIGSLIFVVAVVYLLLGSATPPAESR